MGVEGCQNLQAACFPTKMLRHSAKLACSIPLATWNYQVQGLAPTTALLAYDK